MPTLVTSGVGRLVWGHPLKQTQRTDPQTKQKLFKDGQPVMSYPFGVAYPKQEFFQSQMWMVMQQTVQGMYGQNVPPRFSWKMKDGDGVDGKGKPYRDREGYAGCIVINFDTQFTINAYRPNQAGGWDQITVNDFKTGDYIAVNVSIDGNKPAGNSTNTPSLYMNTQGILHIGNGKEIINAPSADQMFAGQQFQLPPGAAAPGAPPAMPAGMPNPPGMGGMPPGASQPPQFGAPGAPMQTPGYPQGGPSQQQPMQTIQGAPAQYYNAPNMGPQAQMQASPQSYPSAPDFVQAATGQPPQQSGFAPQMAGHVPMAQNGMPNVPGMTAQYHSNVPGMPPGFPNQ